MSNSEGMKQLAKHLGVETVNLSKPKESKPMEVIQYRVEYVEDHNRFYWFGDIADPETGDIKYIISCREAGFCSYVAAYEDMFEYAANH